MLLIVQMIFIVNTDTVGYVTTDDATTNSFYH